MKTILSFLFVFSLGLAWGESIDLKITYNGQGIDGHTVHVMIGGASLGSGTTNSNGEVTISVSTLPTKSIDLKGEKTCNNAKKSWEVSGYVTLDDNNYAHLKMEVPMQEMADASGGFMGVDMLAKSYGLVCSGSSSGGATNSGADNSSAGTDIALPTREESLESKRQMLGSRIENIDQKIERKTEKSEKEDIKSKDKNDLLYDIKELEVEKKIAQNDLDRVNLTIEKGRLNKADRTRFKENDENLNEELKQVKEGRKKGKSLVSEEEAAADYTYSEEDLNNMSTMKLKKEKVGLKSTLSKRKLQLKTKKKFMSPNEVNDLEAEIAKIEAAIALIEAEITARGGSEEEETEVEEEKKD
jgi:hypothetical protein